MIGIYDEPVAVPIIDLLDSNMMSQYISAAREQYNQAVQDQKEFAKEFGELYSPSSDLNKAYYDQTKGRVNKAIDYLYQNGIDPLRSAEGRAYIQKIIRETPYEKIANWKSDAENMKLYNKAAASLAAEGKYDKEYADWTLAQQGLSTMDKFDPYGDTRWTAISPVKYQNIDEFSKPYGDSIKPGLLTKQDVEALGYTYDAKNDYMGISNQQVNSAAGKAVQAMKATPQGQFEIQRIKKQMAVQGLNPTDADAEKAFAGKIASGWGAKVGVQAMDANKYAYAKYNNELADQLDARKSARDLSNQLAVLKKQHEYNVLEGKGSKTSEGITIFDIARAQPNTSAGLTMDSDYGKNNVSFDKNVKISKFPQKDGAPGYTQAKFNTRDVKPIIMKRGTNNPVYWKYTKSDDIRAKIVGNLTYFPKLNGYYIQCDVQQINGKQVTPGEGVVSECWIPVTETVKEK